MISHLGDAILDLLKICAAHGQMVKPLKRVSIQNGLSAKILDGLTWAKFPVKFFNQVTSKRNLTDPNCG